MKILNKILVVNYKDVIFIYAKNFVFLRIFLIFHRRCADFTASISLAPSFKHHKVKGSHTVPDNEVYYAGIFSLGNNIGMHKLANTAIGVNHITLSNATKWYFSFENLHSVNDMITNFINGLWLPVQFKMEIDFLHTSSDGQKRNVSAESLNSNFSYTYFSYGKGSNIYTFIDL
jgi:hypothetical protein